MKHGKKLMAMLLSTAILTASLTACGGSSTAGNTGGETVGVETSGSVLADTSDAEYVIKVANQWGDSSVMSKFITESFGPRVEELTDGRAKIEFYGNNALGNEIDQCGQLQMGTLHLCIISEQSASLDPANLSIGTLPYLFESEEHWDAVTGGELGQEIVANLPNTGIKVLGFIENGYRVITNNKRPINSMEDLKGLKMRVSSSDVMINLFESFGANTISMTLGEVYSAMETGTVDGQENAYNTILTSGFAECQDYIANTNHVLGTMYFAASSSWLDSLPEDVRAAVEQAAAEACEYQHQIFREASESDHQALLDAGMQETNPDLIGFKEAAQVVYDKFYTQYPEAEELVEKIKNLDY